MYYYYTNLSSKYSLLKQKYHLLSFESLKTMGNAWQRTLPSPAAVSEESINHGLKNKLHAHKWEATVRSWVVVSNSNEEQTGLWQNVTYLVC